MSIDIPCCPSLEEHACCDRLDLTYTLPHRVTVDLAGAPRAVTVEVTIRVRFERCPGPLALGELAYTTTLLPGERVRLFSTDRRSRFTYDAETNVSYRHAHASNESYYMTSLAREMSDLTITESGSAEAHSWGDWGAEMDSKYWTIGIAGKGGGKIEGHYDKQSTHEFLRSLSRHAESSHQRTQSVTRTASSVTIGEVATRNHAQGESEDHFESASRTFHNPNHCHAITFFFWQINRVYRMKFTLISIERRVRDPAAPTDVDSRTAPPPTGVSVIPAGVLASTSDRLEVESRAAESAARHVARTQAGAVPVGGAALHAARLQATAGPGSIRIEPLEPLPEAARQAALSQVDQQLVEGGLLDKASKDVAGEVAQEISWERELCLPTPGVFVKGCLDDCDICEPAVREEIAISLERKKLENELLKKQIELLDKSQEYRCCPEGTEEEAPES